MGKYELGFVSDHIQDACLRLHWLCGLTDSHMFIKTQIKKSSSCFEILIGYNVKELNWNDALYVTCSCVMPASPCFSLARFSTHAAIVLSFLLFVLFFHQQIAIKCQGGHNGNGIFQ